MYPVDHDITSSFEQFGTVVIIISRLATSWPNHSFFGLIRHFQASSWRRTVRKVRRVHLLKIFSSTSPLPLLVCHEVNICSSDTAHLKARLGTELLQGLLSESDIISNDMALDILSEIPDTALIVFPHENCSSTRQRLVLIPIPSRPTNAALLYIPQRLPKGKTTSLSWVPSIVLLCCLKSFAFEGIPQYIIKGADHIERLEIVTVYLRTHAKCFSLAMEHNMVSSPDSFLT